MTLKTRRPTGAPSWPLILAEGPTLSTLPIRFWQKVSLEGPTVLDTPCWLWTGANSGTARPYGVSWDGRRRVKAHRWTTETVHGPIPPGRQVDHLCKQTLCVRPSHLEVVTQQENIRRGDAPGPRAVRENTCKWGHEYTADNTIWKSRGAGRECRRCSNAQKRAYKARLRAARRAA